MAIILIIMMITAAVRMVGWSYLRYRITDVRNGGDVGSKGRRFLDLSYKTKLAFTVFANIQAY